MLETHLTPQDYAKIKNISRQRINFLLNRGRIKGAFKFGQIWIIPAGAEILPPKQL